MLEEEKIENNSEQLAQEEIAPVTVKVTYDLLNMKVTGYYPSSENYSQIPEPNITISEEEWREAIDRGESQVKCDLSGLEVYEPSDDEIVAELKLNLIGVRRNYLSQSAIYYAPDFPPEVEAKRASARSEIESIKTKSSVAQLQNFSTDYSVNF